MDLFLLDTLSVTTILRWIMKTIVLIIHRSHNISTTKGHVYPCGCLIIKIIFKYLLIFAAIEFGLSNPRRKKLAAQVAIN